ncbi:MAG TPA: hypothetical protein VFX97_16235 [Pyrinomonadaceae bacterium]|nr:hypothetical protein [Pyrinomonadaceae bacterium]
MKHRLKSVPLLITTMPAFLFRLLGLDAIRPAGVELRRHLDSNR